LPLFGASRGSTAMMVFFIGSITSSCFGSLP
jgi:hypothetical protein